jgi:hypothetical protein
MRKHVAWAAALWLAGALIAAAGATAAVNFLGTGLFGASGKPMTQAEVQQDLARPAPAAASGQPSPAPGASGPSRTQSAPAAGSVKVLAGGTMFASCSSGLARLTWTLGQGYEADGSQMGPARAAWVKLKSGSTEQLVTVTCQGDHPRYVVSAPDDRGGHGGGGSNGGGSGSSGHDG